MCIVQWFFCYTVTDLLCSQLIQAWKSQGRWSILSHCQVRISLKSKIVVADDRALLSPPSILWGKKYPVKWNKWEKKLSHGGWKGNGGYMKHWGIRREGGGGLPTDTTVQQDWKSELSDLLNIRWTLTNKNVLCGPRQEDLDYYHHNYVVNERLCIWIPLIWSLHNIDVLNCYNSLLLFICFRCYLS